MLSKSFEEICDIIKKDSKNSKLIDSVDKLLGMAIICAPVFAGPAAACCLPLIAVKNELIKIGKSVFRKYISIKDKNYIERNERMHISYGLMCITSFFEALDGNIPNELREKLSSLNIEKFCIKENKKCKKDKGRRSVELDGLGTSCMPCLNIDFPRPAETLNEQLASHELLWSQMGQGFIDFITGLELWEEFNKEERNEILNSLRRVPEDANNCFRAQYFELSSRYEDFAVWANLQEHDDTKELIGSLSDYVQRHASLMISETSGIDIGLKKMQKAVQSIPVTLKVAQAAEIYNSLKIHSENRVLEPIADQGDLSRADNPSFPRVCDAFIPQNFKVLYYNQLVKSLEAPKTWDGLQRRESLGGFLLSSLTSPYSTVSPVVVLGHPGSGKSLLTKMLAARLMSEHFTVIRVPLREVDAEVSIVTQIEERIRSITHVSDPWAKLSIKFKNNPPLVILDGYDELLQASGKVFRSYLKDVQNFQSNELEQGRPVRVIVTSRITLIDKAIVPEGATIIRLLKFDERQRECWADIWNKKNTNYFRRHGVKKFELPVDDGGETDKILALAEQPLLLLMLALYDSEDNALGKSKSLDRTILYDSLLRRFVNREFKKNKSFYELSDKDKDDNLDGEMKRLAVAALGMYNRRKLHILSAELNEDISFFDLQRPIKVNDGRELSQAELLLGRFFFVHKSEAKVKKNAANYREETAAFEFLHNTFGEFLTADFIIRQAVSETAAFKALSENDDLRAQLESRLSSADSLGRAWYASLVYTPLFTRPVVLEMIREWIGHSLGRKGLSMDDFIEQLDKIIMNQMKRVLEKREMPSIFCKDIAQEGFRAPFGDHPLLGHVAVYSINLILLRVIVGDVPFIFDEDSIGVHEDGARPWDRLTNIWRSWFSLENLNGITAVLHSRRDKSKVFLTTRERFQLADSQSRLEACHNVAASLGDDIAVGLTGLFCSELPGGKEIDLYDISKRLRSEKIFLDYHVATRLLEKFDEDLDRIYDCGSVDEFIQCANDAVELILENRARSYCIRVASCIRAGFMKMKRSIACSDINSVRIRFRDCVHPRAAVEFGLADPVAGLLLYRTAEDVRDYEWIQEFRLRFFDLNRRRWHASRWGRRGFNSFSNMVSLAQDIGWLGLYRHVDSDFLRDVLNPHYFLDMKKHRPEIALMWVQLAKEAGHKHIFKLLDQNFVEQIFCPHDILKMLRRNPEMALTWGQLSSEIGGDLFYGQIDEDFFKHVFQPRHYDYFISNNPELAMHWVLWLKEISEKCEFRYWDEEVFRLIAGLHNFRRMLDDNPRIALMWIKFMCEMRDWKFKRKYVADIAEAVFNSRRSEVFVDVNPDVALECMQLGFEIYGPEFLERIDSKMIYFIFNKHYYKALLYHNSVLALMWVKLIRDIGNARILDDLNRDAFFDSILFDYRNMKKPANDVFCLASIVMYVRLNGDHEEISRLIDFLSGATKYRGLNSMLDNIPVSSVPDLTWLHDYMPACELKSKMRDWLDSL